MTIDRITQVCMSVVIAVQCLMVCTAVYEQTSYIGGNNIHQIIIPKGLKKKKWRASTTVLCLQR